MDYFGITASSMVFPKLSVEIHAWVYSDISISATKIQVSPTAFFFFFSGKSHLNSLKSK